MPTQQLLRRHPNLQQLMQDCQMRLPQDEELELYLQVAPEFQNRVKAVREIREVETPIVRKVMKRIFEVYPMEQNFEMAISKATRDTRFVINNCVLAMLMGDQQWLLDKVLYWLRSIYNALRFPDKLPHKDYIFSHDAAAMQRLQKIKPYQRVVFETYNMIREEMRNSFSPETFAEIDPYIVLVIDTITLD